VGEVVVTYIPKRKLRAHQVEALDRIKVRPSMPSSADVFSLLCDMGVGKSAIVLAEFGEREDAGNLQDMLIVADAGNYLNWCNDKSDTQLSQFKEHMSDELYGRLTYAPWISGGNKTERKAVDDLLAHRNGPRILLMNVEALSTVKAAKEACVAFLTAPERRSIMVLDESTSVRGASKRSEVVTKIGALANARRILTGLVAPKSPLDPYRQYAFLDWRIIGHQSFYSFRARYATLRNMTAGGRTFKVVTGYQNVEELQKKIAPYSFRVLKDDVLDLPPKVYQQHEVKLTDEQTRMYKELKKFATSALDAVTHVTATAVVTQIIRLHQLICGHVVDEQATIHEVPSNRTDELVKILKRRKGKSIIWVTYQHTLQQVAARLAEEFGAESIATFYGGNRNTRAEDERRWLSDPKCRFMISTPAAGGKGNTWVEARTVIYFANNFDLEQRMQSEDRSHRDGLKHEVTYIDLVAKGTVDEKIIKALRAKINMASVITGDSWREWVV
jgi:hypothetical protein